MTASYEYDASTDVWNMVGGYENLTFDELDNFVEFGQPYSPGNPNFNNAIYLQALTTPEYRPKVIIPNIEAAKQLSGYLPNILDFDASLKFVNEAQNLADGIYSLQDLSDLGVISIGGAATDEFITTNLYGLPDGPNFNPVWVFFFGSVQFKLGENAVFIVQDGNPSIYADVGFSSDNFDFTGGTTLANLFNWVYVPTLGPDAENFTLDMEFFGSGATSFEGIDCFLAGTPITLSDGTTKPIEAITRSDVVLTHDANGNAVPGVVTKLFTNTTSEFIHLSFADDRDDLVATPGHRFLTETGDYMEIGHMLRLGGGTVRVVDVDGSIIEAAGEVIAYSAETAHMFDQSATKTIAFEGNTVLKEDVEQGWTTYNFEVKEHHNYVAGGVRVHNDSILSTLEAGDTLIALNDDLTDMAVLRNVNPEVDGTQDFVVLDGSRFEDVNGGNTFVNRTLVYEWNAANPALNALFAFELGENRAPDANDEVFDQGLGNNWNDGTFGDDIEEVFFNDILGLTDAGTPARETIDSYYSYATVGSQPVPTLEALVLAAATGGADALIGALFAPLAESETEYGYDLGDGDLSYAPTGPSPVDLLLFVLGLDASAELIPGVPNPLGGGTIGGVTLGDFLNGLDLPTLGTFALNFGVGISSDDVTRAQDGDNLILTVADADGPTTWTLEGVYADGAADEIVSINFADGTSLTLDEVTDGPVMPDGIVRGTDGNDSIDGLDGNDIILALDGDDTVFAGNGDDIVSGNADSDELRGQAGDDVIEGNSGNDDLRGGSGNDTIFGNQDDDDINGGSGDDVLSGGTGADDFYFTATGDGNDVISDFSVYADRVKIGGVFVDPNAPETGVSLAQLGSDVVITYAGSDTITLSGIDLAFWQSRNPVSGTEDDDIMYGTEYADEMYGNDGDDRIYAGDDGDTLYGGQGDDRLRGNGGDDVLYGNRDDDNILGHAGEDYAKGGSGNDAISGGDDNDTLLGETGEDWLYGDAGDDRVQGGDGNDKVRGNEGNDIIVGDRGADTLYAGAGQDELVGGSRAYDGSSYTSDSDVDTFVFQAVTESAVGIATRDTIADFDIGTDQIDLSVFGFTFETMATANGVWATASGANDAVVFGDTDGDGVADLEILLMNVDPSALSASDFIL